MLRGRSGRTACASPSPAASRAATPAPPSRGRRAQRRRPARGPLYYGLAARRGHQPRLRADPPRLRRGRPAWPSALVLGRVASAEPMPAPTSGQGIMPGPRRLDRRHDPCSFAVTWDYRCPFARNAHEHVLTGLRGRGRLGRELRAVLARPGARRRGRDRRLGRARRRHRPARPAGRRRRARPVPRPVPRRPPRAVRPPPRRRAATQRADVAPRRARGARRRRRRGLRRDRDRPARSSTIRKEHEPRSPSTRVWGVPTFIAERRGRRSSASWTGPEGDSELAPPTRRAGRRPARRWPELNEFKHTSIPR